MNAKFFGYIIGVIIVTLILPLILKWMWNIFIIEIFPVPAISYTQSLGLYVVSQILLKTTVNYGK